MKLGYKISSEEHSPADLIRYARRAEELGFEWAGVSDHFHPWVDKQGHSPFVWSLLGAMAEATDRIPIGTWVTCPTVRMHPAIVAQASATAAAMMPGRFFLGLGSGENLNEHILGDHWPEPSVRLDMLAEAVELIRLLWEGDMTSFRGDFYVVENARLYLLPEAPPPIYLAGSGKRSASLAGEAADGFVGVAPKKDIIEAFDEAGGRGKPKLAEITICWAQSEEEARQTAYEWWPNALTEGGLSAEMALPSLFEAVAKTATPEHVAEKMPCGPDTAMFLRAIEEYSAVGYDYIALHQVGPDQEGFFRFCERELLPELRTTCGREAVAKPQG